ncbi:MAG: amidohydrolase [Chloroflexi bacterium]|nr:amidohydrolase [Chloroflexota bacterium]
MREYNIPVLVHFGIQGGGGGIAWHENINPLKLHNVAKDFPDVTFVVPHFGCAWIRETLQLCWACRNVCIDTSGSNQWVAWVDGDWTTKKLFRKYMETIGPERIIFGSDSSYFPRGFAVRYLDDQIRDCRELNLTHEQQQLIFGGNAARLFKIDLHAGT